MLNSFIVACLMQTNSFWGSSISLKDSPNNKNNNRNNNNNIDNNNINSNDNENNN